MINRLQIFILAIGLGFSAIKCGAPKQQIQVSETVNSLDENPWGSTNNAPHIYRRKCATCHTLERDVGSGPSLKNVMQKVPNEQWFYNFVSNEDSLIEMEDPYTLEVNKWSSKMHFTHRFTTISKVQMDSIIDFLK